MNPMDFDPSGHLGTEVAHRKEFMRRAFRCLAFNGIGGDYAEFGCWGATTFRLAWAAAKVAEHPAHFWAFDSFAGLPNTGEPSDAHPQWIPGTMATPVEAFRRICTNGGIPADAFTVVAGFYETSLRADMDGPRPTHVSLAYIDCDLYSSTQEVLTFLQSRLQPGSILAFDDYYCYSPDGPSGERLAAAEHFRDGDWQLVPYVQFGWHGMSFVVERRDAVPSSPVGW